MKNRMPEIIPLEAGRVYVRSCETQPSLKIIELRNHTMQVTLTTMGCSVMRIVVPDRMGVEQNVVAGYVDPGAYTHNPHYMGCTIGRYANRIGAGTFEKDGQVYCLPLNEGMHLLHGGRNGFHQKNWQVAAIKEDTAWSAVTMELISADGEEGFPGNLTVSVRYTLYDDNKLEIVYNAVSDRDTPVNFTNHSYFNLSGFRQPQIYGHLLRVCADFHTEKSPLNIPTGRIVPNQGTPLDFSQPKLIEKDIHALEVDNGYDHNFVLQKETGPAIQLAAVVYEPVGGISLKVSTDRPGMQLYTANAWDGIEKGAHEMAYMKHGALALETQAFPDSVNHPGFPDTWLKAGEKFSSTTVFEFGLENPF